MFNDCNNSDDSDIKTVIPHAIIPIMIVDTVINTIIADVFLCSFVCFFTNLIIGSIKLAIIKAINQDNIDLLKEYPKKFYKKYLKELKYQFKVQKTLNIFSNEDLDYFFIKLKENNCEHLISKYGDMDNQSILVKEIIKRGLLFKIIPSFFIKKVSKIFGF